MNRLVGCGLGPRLSLTWCLVRGLTSAHAHDCYATLGLTHKADQKEIKQSFYKLSKLYHPDLNKDDESALKKFKQVAEAYEILSNPEKRSEYDLKMGFSKSSVNQSDIKFNSYGGGRRRFNGMKGEFRNGRFVDDEAVPEMRNIEYDLSPEKMEKIWKRYKVRWERIDEIEKLEELEKKKIEFRKRFDIKREKMIQNKMSKEEKAEFMHKIRLHRIDAVEGFDTTDKIKKEKSPERENKENLEFLHKKGKDQPIKERAEKGKEQAKSNRETKSSQDDGDSEKEFEKSTRDILKKHFGLSDLELDRLDIGSKKENQQQREYRQTLNDNDPLYQGMKTAADATDWRDYVTKTYRRNKETWDKLKTNRIDNPVNSDRYNIGVQKEDHYGTKIVLIILISAIILGYREFRLDKSHDDL